MTKDLFFNDLSQNQFTKDKIQIVNRITAFANLIKKVSDRMGYEVKLKTENGISGIELYENQTLEQFFCYNIRELRTLASYLRSKIRRPYIMPNSIEEDNYCYYSFYLIKNDRKEKPEGLTSAYLHESIAIGFLSESFWNNCKFKLIKKSELEESECDVFCISEESHLKNPDIEKWFDDNSKLELIATTIDSAKKSIKLRDDHGKDILFDLAKRLVNCEYVEKIINSLKFNSHETNFIRSVKENGIVEIVKTDTDAGYGLVVKTTGRNRKETKAIAEILRKKYSK